MRTSRIAFTLLLALLCGPVRADTLSDARERWLKGNYAEAQELYAKAAADQPIAAAVGLSRTLESRGEYDEALATVEKALKDRPKDPALLARQAELLYLRGRWDEAEKAADAAVAGEEEAFLARWVRVQIYRDRGDEDKSDQECRWFIRTYVRHENADDPIKDPEKLVLVGLAGLENARRHSLSDQFRFILNDVYADALKYDKAYWPAEYESGVLLLEKFNRGEAIDAFDKVLALNPNAAEALVGKGAAAVQKFEIKQAESFAERALKINPRLPIALHLRADIHLMVGDIDAALKELATARKVNPRDERTLGRVAACYHLQNKKADADALLAEVKKFDPKPAVFHFQLGERLEEQKRFDLAQAHLRLASELRPKMPGPANSLGMLYMRMGREKEAKVLLDAGFDADPFNVRVSNMRKVLRHLEKYEDIQTKHFLLRYDPKKDAILAAYLADYLEVVYEDLAGQFDYRPKGPILIEVFNSHQMFSGRTIGLPDLHTIGACTGRVVAMVSPEGRGVPRAFNWGRVIRHELVHIFNLEQTNFLVPHWLTEGLAVRNEGFPRPQVWNKLLRQRVPAGELMNLDNVQLGFIRPRNPLEWQMAYCQSELYVEYLVKEYGEKAVGKLLAAYAEGLNTDAAISRVCGVDKAAFEKGYRGYLEEVVKSLGSGGKAGGVRDQSTEDLQAAHEKDKDDVDVAAELAYRLLSAGKVVEARGLAEKVIEKKEAHPRALYVLAQLEKKAGDVKEHRRLLEKGLDKDAPDPAVVRALGKLYYDAEEFGEAAAMFELGRKAEPFDNTWLAELVRVYAQKGDKKNLITALIELVPTDADDFTGRSRLAKLLAEEDRHAEAERFAREALEIKVKDEEMQGVLLKALKAQGKDTARLEKAFGS